ncbi:hypothetical protein FKR81_35225 [Lentzea tibetensis]|uniref:Carrier domain-containing protein n=1 Tax=Lentzea tibetensis TaxID=2591470 RepID=A0A563EIQ1_9PSEU|nr:hypothetical protein FKR81_35225 [Lentzea tibetensis]
MDALALHRRSRGLPATSVAWGHWAGGGIGEGVIEERLQRLGVTPLRPEVATAALRRVLDHDEVFVAVADLDWACVAEAGSARPNPLLREIPEFGVSEVPGDDALRVRLAKAKGAERDGILLDLVRGHAAAVLGHRSISAVGARTPFHDIGFDSVMSVDLRNRLEAATGCKLPASVLFDHPTPAGVVDRLRDELVLDDRPTPASVLAGLNQLSDELAALSAGGEDHDTIALVLRNLLAQWTAAEDVEEIESASADDLLDLIQREFGKN